MLPANLALTVVALVRRALRRRDIHQDAMLSARRSTILLSGGKMTKALTLARAFHRAGHRVILVETAKYRYTGHRFSSCVDRFHVVPPPDDPRYAQALRDIVIAEGVDLYVPVSSPTASYYDALAAPLLAPHCTVLHADAETVRRLDDKYELTVLAASLGLPVPDTYRITAPEQASTFDFDAGATPFILKSIAYDPVHRLDLTRLPLASAAGTADLASSKPISSANPWILQSFVEGREYCTHATVVGGRVLVYVCCPSSGFQVNYAWADKPAIEAWVRAFVEPLAFTGQISFDFIETADGRVFPIECNPRTHSAITMLCDHPDLAAAYLGDDVARVTPTAASRPTFWLYHELWRALTRPDRIVDRIRTVTRGREAIFDWDDPLPFLLVHHLQIPALLITKLLTGQDWIRIDFNIGKLVEAAGD